jgi:hypothetical protein
MTRPRFSIVVPTRQRPHTLRHTLATIVSQDHDDYEIVVADNASGPETRRVIEDLACPRLVSVRSEAPISMAANWQRALAATRGEWITFIGDDDGLLPGALARCDALIAAHRVRSIHQHYGIYIWPCAGATGEADRLQLHLGRRVRVESTRAALEAMVARPTAAPIPLPYHGWIHRSLYEEAARSGPVFQGQDPDTYAGILCAALGDEFVASERPLSLLGISGTSNTLCSFVTDQPGAAQREGDALNAEAGFARHPLVPDVPVIAAVLLDGLHKVADRLGPDRLPPLPTPLQVALHCGRGVWRADEAGRRQWATIRDTLTTPADREAFDAASAELTPAGRPRRMTCVDRGRAGPFIVLDTAELGVRTIAAAATAAAATLATTEVCGFRQTRLAFRGLERGIRRKVRGWWQTAVRAAG